ncbi:MAG: RsbRD N-terminal domain-containing protein [Nitrospirota bacterium]
MNLKSILSEKKSAILERWFDLILETYPQDTVNFIKSQKNRFANPVGSTIFQGMQGVLDEIMQQELDSAGVAPFLDNIIRIRAVQDFKPSQALSFIPDLKKIIRDVLSSEIMDKQSSDEVRLLESRIDRLLLISFDVYVNCREKLYDIRANEVKRSTFRLLQRAKLMTDLQEDEKDNNSKDFINIKRKEANK